MEQAPRTLVKVCGITSEDDARVALDAGADLLGFVLANTPRSVTPLRAAEILHAVPGARAVAVMVQPTPDQALAMARTMGAVRVQLHGVDPGRWPRDFPLPQIFAITVTREAPHWEAPSGAPHWVLCDSLRDGLWGGTGQSFDWSLVEALARRAPLLLAGGLDGGNVERALRQVRPMGVDASSRLERSPGVKDPVRVREFVAAVRRFDHAVARAS
jgi:phosphoribosylanthranilate isomerase